MENHAHDSHHGLGLYGQNSDTSTKTASFFSNEMLTQYSYCKLKFSGHRYVVEQ